jgi:methylenetetrahydrofolate dehydrogenase (NAD+)
LLKIPGVVYVPLVGKVTVAMLERNLMRLYEQFHALNRYPVKAYESSISKDRGNSIMSFRLQLYSAAVLTAILALQLLKK